MYMGYIVLCFECWYLNKQIIIKIRVFHNIVIALYLHFRNSSLLNSKSNYGPKNLLQKSKSYSSSHSRYSII